MSSDMSSLSSHTDVNLRISNSNHSKKREQNYSTGDFSLAWAHKNSKFERFSFSNTNHYYDTSSSSSDCEILRYLMLHYTDNRKRPVSLKSKGKKYNDVIENTTDKVAIKNDTIQFSQLSKWCDNLASTDKNNFCFDKIFQVYAYILRDRGEVSHLIRIIQNKINKQFTVHFKTLESQIRTIRKSLVVAVPITKFKSNTGATAGLFMHQTTDIYCENLLFSELEKWCASLNKDISQSTNNNSLDVCKSLFRLYLYILCNKCHKLSLLTMMQKEIRHLITTNFKVLQAEIHIIRKLLINKSSCTTKKRHNEGVFGKGTYIGAKRSRC